MISLKFLKSSFIYTFIGSLPMISSLILLPFYGNEKLLSLADYGLLALFIAFTFLIQATAGFGLDSYITISTAKYKDDPEEFRKNIGNVVGYLLIIGSLLIILFLFLGRFLFEIIFNEGYNIFLYGIMSVFTGIFNTFFKTYTNLLVNQERSERYFWLNICNFILTISISLTGIYMFPLTLIGPMWGRFLSGMGIFLIALLSFIKEFGFSLNNYNLAQAWKFCYPIVIFSILTWSLSFSDRYIISPLMTKNDVGVFDFATKFTLLIDFALNGLSTAIMPKIYALLKEEPTNLIMQKLNRYFSGYNIFMLVFIPINILLIPMIVPYIITNTGIHNSFYYLAILSIGFISRGLLSIYTAPIYFFHKTSTLPRILGLVSAFQIGLSILLIKYFGLYGAAYSTLLIKIIQVIFVYFPSRKIYKFDYNCIKLIFLPIAYIIFVIATETFIRLYRWNMDVTHCIQLLFAVSSVAIVYRNELRSFTKDIKTLLT